MKIKRIGSLQSWLEGTSSACRTWQVRHVRMTKGQTETYQEHQDQKDLKYHDPHSLNKTLRHCFIFLACYSLFIIDFWALACPRPVSHLMTLTRDAATKRVSAVHTAA